MAEEANCESTRKHRNWVELPIEVTENILNRLRTVEILTSAIQVCRVWRNICKDPLRWRTIDMTDFDLLLYGSYLYLRKICRFAIDLSFGCLQDIRIYQFGTNDLLRYMAADNRASNLQCIWLICCKVISDKGLSEVAKKLPLLEELRISETLLTGASLEVIGQCCPLLKSLVFNGSSQEFSFDGCDDEAFAIAKTMPGLRRLDIRGNSLTNAGLLAILDGCPLLESLDLRECSYLDLSGSLGERCREQIKDLQLRTYYSDSYYHLQEEIKSHHHSYWEWDYI